MAPTGMEAGPLALPQRMANPQRSMSKPLVEVLKVGKRGELVLPRRVRNSLKLQEGDEVILTVVDSRIILERRARNFGAYLDVISTAVGPKRDE